MTVKLWLTGVALGASFLSGASNLEAQALGTFRWQLSPLCNVVTLNVVQQGPVFVLSGFDDGCGQSNPASATGTAFFNPNGAIGMGLTVITTGGGAVTYSIQLDPGTLSGTWVDSSGATGTFAFSPAVPAQGSPRPQFFGPGIRTISPGTAVTLEPRACYAIFAYGVGAVGDAGRLVTGFLRSINGQAIVNNQFVMLPGTVNLTSPGGTLGYVLGCNLASTPQTLPAGWQIVTRAFTLP